MEFSTARYSNQPLSARNKMLIQAGSAHSHFVTRIHGYIQKEIRRVNYFLWTN